MTMANSVKVEKRKSNYSVKLPVQVLISTLHLRGLARWLATDYIYWMTSAEF